MEEISQVERFLIVVAALATVHGFVTLIVDVANAIQGALYYQSHPAKEEDDEDPVEFELALSVWDYIPFMVGLAFLIINYAFLK